jgi:hypothetical protein
MPQPIGLLRFTRLDPADPTQERGLGCVEASDVVAIYQSKDGQTEISHKSGNFLAAEPVEKLANAYDALVARALNPGSILGGGGDERGGRAVVSSSRAEEFARFVESIPPREGPFEPIVHYDADGDCIEVFFSNESFRGKWIKGGLTQYVGEEGGNVVGCLIEGVSRLMDPKGGR